MNTIFNITKTHLTVRKTLIAAVLLTCTLTASAQNKVPGKIHFGIVYPLSTNGTHASLDTNNLSFNLIGGLSAAERGLAFAGLTNVVLNDTKGLMFAGFSNHIRKTADGALFAGFVNTYGGGKGVAFAGFSNIASGNVNGAQFASFVNFAKEVSASQLAGFINVAKDVKGSQFAGFINIAKKVKGSQVAGFINIADSSDYPIGLINIVKNGEKSIGVSIDEHQTTMLTFRSGGKVLYGIIGIGYNFKNAKEIYAYEAGFGAHFFKSKRFRLNTELVASSLESFDEGRTFKSSLRVMPALKLTPFLEIFGGPSLHYLNSDTYEGRTLQKKYIKSWENKYGNNFHGLYVGYTGGIHVIF